MEDYKLSNLLVLLASISETIQAPPPPDWLRQTVQAIFPKSRRISDALSAELAANLRSDLGLDQPQCESHTSPSAKEEPADEQAIQNRTP